MNDLQIIQAQLLAFTERFPKAGSDEFRILLTCYQAIGLRVVNNTFGGIEVLITEDIKVPTVVMLPTI